VRSEPGDAVASGDVGFENGGYEGDDFEGDDEAVAEELRRVRAEIAGTPAIDIVANHAVGLWQLAVLHLSPEDGTPVRLDEAAIAIDAMGGLVESLGDRLGDHGAALRDAVSQLRMAFVEVQKRTSGTSGTSGI
jgi:hypothetical protein